MMSGVHRRALAAVCGLLVLLCGACAGGAAGAAAATASPAPALRGTDLDGRTWDIADLRGSVVLVSAWASWCAPCRDEVPVLSRAQDRLGGSGLVVLGLDVQDDPGAARDFVAAERPSFPSVVDADGTIAVGWGVAGLPQTFVVDREGSMVAHRLGPVTDRWIDDVVVPEVRP